MGNDEEYLVVSRSAIVKIVRPPPISVLKSVAGRNEVPAASGKRHPGLTAVNCGRDEQRCIAGRDHINPQIVVAVEAAMGELAVIAQRDEAAPTDQQPQCEAAGGEDAEEPAHQAITSDLTTGNLEPHSGQR